MTASKDSDHNYGRIDKDSFVKNALFVVFVWEKLNYISAGAMYTPEQRTLTIHSLTRDVFVFVMLC
jgi:hypothetical protein